VNEHATSITADLHISGRRSDHKPFFPFERNKAADDPNSLQGVLRSLALDRKLLEQQIETLSKSRVCACLHACAHLTIHFLMDRFVLFCGRFGGWMGVQVLLMGGSLSGKSTLSVQARLPSLSAAERDAQRTHLPVALMETVQV
jgi:hypothetical protein